MSNGTNIPFSALSSSAKPLNVAALQAIGGTNQHSISFSPLAKAHQAVLAHWFCFSMVVGHGTNRIGSTRKRSGGAGAPLAPRVCTPGSTNAHTH